MNRWLGMVCICAVLTEAGGCGGSAAATGQVNEPASLTGQLPWNPLGWKVITSAIDKQAATMSTLYGNDLAVQYARRNAQSDYPAGSVLSLVTWSQQEDARWFGGKIPAQVKSVEFVIAKAGPNGMVSYSYESYQGSPLARTPASDGSFPESRATYLRSMRAAVMP